MIGAWYDNFRESGKKSICSGAPDCGQKHCPHFCFHEYRDAYCGEYVCEHLLKQRVVCIIVGEEK